MGPANAGSATGITVQTDADVTASAGTPSGGIFDAPTDVQMVIASGNRVPNRSNVAVVVTFKTGASALAIGGKITLTYPTGFFATSATPAANTAGSTSVPTMTATSAAPTATQIVITTAVAGIAANTAFTITLSGLTMGPANAGSATGITVQTDTANTIASAGVPSGGIGSSVTALSISPSSTGLAVAAVTVIVRFTTSAAGLIAAGGRISLGFPTGWFDRTVTPANNAAGTSSVPTLTASSVIPVTASQSQQQ